MVWTGFIWLRTGSMEVYCESSNEPIGSINCWEVFKSAQVAASQEALRSVFLVRPLYIKCECMMCTLRSVSYINCLTTQYLSL
jgi:hypothetical protein